MRVKDSAILQQEQLVLSASLDELDASASYRAETRGRQAPPKRWMKKCDTGDGLPNGSATQPANGVLDLW